MERARIIKLDETLREHFPDENFHRDFLARFTNVGTRLMGSDGEAAAFSMIASELGELGFNIARQRFAVPHYRRRTTRLSLLAEGKAKPLEALAAVCSPPTAGEITVALRDLGAGDEKAFDRAPDRFDGEAVLLTRASRKAHDRASQAGAAVVIEASSPALDRIRMGYVDLDTGTPACPKIKVSHSTGEILSRACSIETARVCVVVDGETETVTSGNLEAAMPGTHDLPPLLVGAHVDGFSISPGAIDNGTGVSAAMAMARAWARVARPLRTVRFVFFTGEEADKLGSRRYASARLPETPGAYMNFDVPVGGSPVLHVMAGPDDPTPFWAELGAVLDDRFRVERNFRRNSDHYPFYRAGWPCLMMRARPETPGVDVAPLIHTDLDTLDRVPFAELAAASMRSGRVVYALANLHTLPFSAFTPHPDDPQFYPDPG